MAGGAARCGEIGMSDEIRSALPERHSLDKRIADLTRDKERLLRAVGDDRITIEGLREKLCAVEKRVAELGAELRRSAAGEHIIVNGGTLLRDYADLFGKEGV